MCTVFLYYFIHLTLSRVCKITFIIFFKVSIIHPQRSLYAHSWVISLNFQIIAVKNLTMAKPQNKTPWNAVIYSFLPLWQGLNNRIYYDLQFLIFFYPQQQIPWFQYFELLINMIFTVFRGGWHPHFLKSVDKFFYIFWTL